MDWNKKVSPLDIVKACVPNVSFAWIPKLLDKWQDKLKGKVRIDPKPAKPNTTRYNRPIRTRSVSSSGSSQSRATRYPCRTCTIKDDCDEACDLIELNDDLLMDLFMAGNCCPDCGSDRFIEGPSGGAATNVRCRGCGHYFNFGLPLFIQRIHISDGKWQKGFME